MATTGSAGGATTTPTGGRASGLTGSLHANAHNGAVPPASLSLAWEVPRLQQELHAALSAAAAATRSAAVAEELASQQQASFALSMRRERERLRAEHQAEVSRVWKQIADLQGGAQGGAGTGISKSPPGSLGSVAAGIARAPTALP